MYVFFLWRQDDLIIIHAKDALHTCLTQLTRMINNSRARKKYIDSQKQIHVHKIRILYS